MGLEAVKEEIIRNSKQQESSMIAEARKEANAILKEAEKKIDEMKEKAEADYKKAADSAKRQALSSAGTEGRKMLLEAKKQAIESAFAEARKSIEALDDNKRELYIKRLLEKAAMEITVGKAYCSKKDLKFIKGAEAEPTGIIGGLIAESREGTVRIDFSFEALLEQVKEREMHSINKLLFG